MGVKAPVPPPCTHPAFRRDTDGRFACNDCAFTLPDAGSAVAYLNCRAAIAAKATSSPAPPPIVNR